MVVPVEDPPLRLLFRMSLTVLRRSAAETADISSSKESQNLISYPIFSHSLSLLELPTNTRIGSIIQG